MGAQRASADFLFDRQTHPKICEPITRPRLTKRAAATSAE
jgi:hypothetical protein